MSDFRLSRGLCAVIGESLSGSHPQLDALFQSSGAPGEPPDLAHHSKWKEWLFRAGQDPTVDGLKVLGNILEEFMDAEPVEEQTKQVWEERRARVERALKDDGLEYYRGGRVLPNGSGSELRNHNRGSDTVSVERAKVGPSSVDELMSVLVRGLPRAMFPLTHRRKGAQSLSFRNEYDIQDLLHALLKPWVADVRAEEFTPSYAGTSTRMDFLLPAHATVIETKLVRDTAHAKRIGDELIIDIAHYAVHPDCKYLWCIVYDPDCLLKNVGGLVSDLEGEHIKGSERTIVRVVVV